MVPPLLPEWGSEYYPALSRIFSPLASLDVQRGAAISRTGWRRFSLLDLGPG
jgi:hypothetical protein